MRRFLVEWQMDQDDLDKKRSESESNDAIIMSGSCYVLAETLTDAAWQVKFMVPHGCEIVSVKTN